MSMFCEFVSTCILYLIGMRMISMHYYSRRYHRLADSLVNRLRTYGQVHFLPFGAFVHTTIALLSTRMLRTKEPDR
jgi:hypothetical protein